MIKIAFNLLLPSVLAVVRADAVQQKGVERNLRRRPPPLEELCEADRIVPCDQEKRNDKIYVCHYDDSIQGHVTRCFPMNHALPHLRRHADDRCGRCEDQCDHLPEPQIPCDDSNLCTSDQYKCDVLTGEWACVFEPSVTCPSGFSCDPQDGGCKKDDACDPYPCGANTFCLTENGNFACFCEDGFSGDPLQGCTGIPDVSLLGISSNSFNNAGTPFCFRITNDEFETDPEGIEVSLNNVAVPSEQLDVTSTEICAKESLTSLYSNSNINQVSISAKAASSGITVSMTETFWTGTLSATLNVVDPLDQPFLGELTVSARLADDASVTEEKNGNGGSIVAFENLSSRTIIFEASTAQGLAGSAGLAGGGTAKITMRGFDEPSTIDNNDFSQGSDGWKTAEATFFSIMEHAEVVGPSSGNRRLETSIINKDFSLSTGGVEGPSYSSRTFQTKPGTTGVRIRYRFQTNEWPDWFGSQYNDYFEVSIRSKAALGSKTEANSMNGLGESAFGLDGSTAWRELILPVKADGDVIQVEALVANVGDGLFQSQLIVDFVEEVKQSLCIYSNAPPKAKLDSGHAALALYEQLESGSTAVTTYGLWPDSHPETPDDGDATDIRTTFEGDNVLGYTYFYCEAISEEQKELLDSLTKENVEWTCLNSCASFASETFEQVTGTDVDADDFLGIETPREITQSILALNKGSPKPAEGLPWLSGGRRVASQNALKTSFPFNFLTACNFI